MEETFAPALEVEITRRTVPGFAAAVAEPLAPDGAIAIIEAVRDALGWDRFYLAAHSMGARVAIRYTRRHQKRVERLALLDFLTAVRKKTRERYEKKMDRRQPTYSSCDGMVQRYHLQPRGTTISDESLRALGADSVTRLDNGRWTWKFDWRGFFMDYEPVWDEVSRIEAPCLIMRGEHSAVMTRPEFEKVLAVLREGCGVEIPGAYHHIPLDAPESVAAGLIDFSRVGSKP
ncbi:MAG: alpha/beta hydrolase [Planctomycetes bacterium]|nr:alpha/beta hydrolase [Planctomycetota bacterium]